MEAAASVEALVAEVSAAVAVPEVRSAAADPADSAVLRADRIVPLITVRISARFSVRFGTVRATTAVAVAVALAQ